jgi:4-hydroxy-tetrahydrodipicolinate synthase
MSAPTLFCMTATPFAADGALDEAALRSFLDRIIACDLGIYLGSGGSGEGHALSHDEMRRIYEIGAEAAHGKVAFHANPPEQHTVKQTIALARIAVEAGIEVVHMYTLAGWHGMKPTPDELDRYFDDVLDKIQHPVAIAVNHTMGYIPTAAQIAAIARRHQQIVAVKLTGVQDTYLIDVKALIDRPMSYYVQPQGSLNALLLGADGIFGSEGNVIPKTYRSYLDHYLSGDTAALGRAYSDLRSFNQFVNRWGPSNPRWLKMAMRILELPGGAGAIREPYRMPSDAELLKFRDGLVRLDIAEVNELLAAAAG